MTGKTSILKERSLTTTKIDPAMPKAHHQVVSILREEPDMSPSNKDRSRERSASPKLMPTEDFSEAQKRLDTKLQSLQSRIDELGLQFDLEKPSDEFFNQAQLDDFNQF